jgi:hypothetical protein
MSDKDKAGVKAADEVEKETVDITEDDLRKTLDVLEKKDETPTEAEKEEKVVTEKLEKTAVEAVDEGASEKLKKAMSENDAFREAVGLMGVHVDTSLETLQKAIESGAALTLQTVRVLEKMTGEITAVGEKLEKFGDKPAGSPKVAVTENATKVDGKTEVLEKTVEGEADKENAWMRDKNVVLQVMQKMVESTVGSNPDKAGQIGRAAIMLETSGRLEKDMATLVKAEMGVTS